MWQALSGFCLDNSAALNIIGIIESNWNTYRFIGTCKSRKRRQCSYPHYNRKLSVLGDNVNAIIQLCSWSNCSYRTRLTLIRSSTIIERPVKRLNVSTVSRVYATKEFSLKYSVSTKKKLIWKIIVIKWKSLLLQIV